MSPRDEHYRMPDTSRRRVLLGGGPAAEADIPPWFASSYRRFRTVVTDPAYPCYFGTAAELRGELYYTFATARSMHLMPATLEGFLRAARLAPEERRNLTVFFPPDDVPLEHDRYRRRFWAFLALLRRHDAQPPPAGMPADPGDPGWEFAFAGTPLFVFGAAPSHRRRDSRNLGPGMIVLMQPRQSFGGIEGHTAAGIAARQQIRARAAAWDGMPAHPDLGIFGDAGNHEWKQYFLADENTPQQGRCPFAPGG